MKNSTIENGISSKLEIILGFAIAIIVTLEIIVASLCYLVFRKRENPENKNELMMEAPAPSGPAAAEQTEGPEVGTTHEAFVGDAAAPEPEVKTVAENAGFVEDTTAF
ncbi:hypothetical protein OS493_016025 [Desmophyllum pertusum]|uniref:Uncharacterized protein n=1 Tax=Desmophyllum pertusum TaxID=174260 RepID=A0A9X0DB91_9CNID|nr:hypothetical protein OS493_016025 [Desmophyllum pertusum]